MRLLLTEFKNEQKIFGDEFIYEQVDLIEAFNSVNRYISDHGNDHNEALRKIQRELFFEIDFMRESTQTTVMALNPPALTVEQDEEDNQLRSLRMKSTVAAISSPFDSAPARVDSVLDTVHLSIDHGIALAESSDNRKDLRL